MSEKIRVLKFEVGKKPYIKEIENDWRDLQKEVDGFFEFVYLENKGVLVCNDCGKINGSKFNRFLISEQGTPVDAIYGDFLVAKEIWTDEGSDLGSLSDEDIEYFSNHSFMNEEIGDEEFIKILKTPRFEIFGF